MTNPWEIFLASCKGPREAPAPVVPPKELPAASSQPVKPKGRTKAAPKAPTK